MTAEARTVEFTIGMRVVVKDGAPLDDIGFGGGFYGTITRPVCAPRGPAWEVDLKGHIAGKPIPKPVPEWFYPDELEVVD